MVRVRKLCLTHHGRQCSPFQKVGYSEHPQECIDLIFLLHAAHIHSPIFLQKHKLSCLHIECHHRSSSSSEWWMSGVFWRRWYDKWCFNLWDVVAWNHDIHNGQDYHPTNWFWHAGSVGDPPAMLVRQNTIERWVMPEQVAKEINAVLWCSRISG